jgi:hypothetical protein
MIRLLNCKLSHTLYTIFNFNDELNSNTRFKNKPRKFPLTGEIFVCNAGGSEIKGSGSSVEDQAAHKGHELASGKQHPVQNKHGS